MVLRTTLLLCCLFACLESSGCASTPSAGDAAASTGPPDDFALDVTILTDKAWPPSPQAHLRSGRYILYSDGSLHYGVDPVRGTNWVPGVTRTLSRSQVAELWELAAQLDLTEPGGRQDPQNLKLVRPAPGQMVYLIACTGRDDRWQFIQRFDAAQSASSSAPAEEPSGTNTPVDSMTALVRRLAALAWVSDLPNPEPYIVPKRYDFGPDPYEQYRTAARSSTTSTELAK